MTNYQSFLKKGKAVEQEFAKLFRDTVNSTPQQDMVDHWDVQINYKFDVKGLKKTNRADKNPNQFIHWVVLRNVNGQSGWLYAPEVDFFVFELINYWLIVQKEKLQQLVFEKIDEVFCETPTLYKLYRRNDRPQEACVLVDTIDLIYISELLIKKQ